MADAPALRPADIAIVGMSAIMPGAVTSDGSGS